MNNNLVYRSLNNLFVFCRQKKRLGKSDVKRKSFAFKRLISLCICPQDAERLPDLDCHSLLANLHTMQCRNGKVKKLFRSSGGR